MSSARPGRPARRRLQAGTALAAAVAVVLIAAPGALAHVSVNPATAEPGGWAKEAFRVPNERDDTSTVRVEVVFPADHPLGHVSVQPVPGWKATVQKQKLKRPVMAGDHEITEAVTSVVWKGGSIRPGEFQEFPLSLGPLPGEEGELVFKALQTYSDGEVVRWIDVPEKGAEEPEHPAPVLALEAAGPAAEAQQPEVATEAGAAADARSAPARDTDVEPGTDIVSRTLAGAGLVVGLVALSWAAAGWRASRKQPAQAVRKEGKVTV